MEKDNPISGLGERSFYPPTPPVDSVTQAGNDLWLSFPGADKRDVYAHIYSNVNPIGTRAVSTPEPGKVVSVARIYLRLDQVIGHGADAAAGGIIQEMYIFADVIEIEGAKLNAEWEETVLGCHQYILLCNKLLADLTGIRRLQNLMRRVPLVVRLTNRHEPHLTMFTGRLFSPGAPVPHSSVVVHCNQFYCTDNNIINPNYVGLPPIPWAPRWALQHPSLLMAMESTITTSEVILHFIANTEGVDRLVEAMVSHVQWLNLTLLQALQERGTEQSAADLHELRMLFFRTQYLLKWPPGQISILVPRLHYTRFDNLIERMANVAEVYDRDFKQLTLFVAHNQAQGTYLFEQNKALAEREQDMEIAHSALYSMKEADLRRGIQNLETLGGQMQEMNAEMDQAREDMEAGLQRYRDQQIARAVFSILGAIAAIGVAILTGGIGARSALSRSKDAVNGVQTAVQTAARLKAVLKTVEKIVELVDVIWELKELIEEVADLAGMSLETPSRADLPEVPSAAEWYIFENEIEAVAADMPTEVSEVAVWKAKCKNVAALGREMTMQCVVVHELRYDIETHRLMAEVARSHADRLMSIQAFMDLTDYQRMATEIDMRTTRITLGLCKVLSLKHAAMRYEYLLPPSPLSITSFTISTIHSLLINQEVTAVAALNDLGIPTDHTITYLVRDIPIELLLDGEPWDFNIDSMADNLDFPSHWKRVRISHLQLHFTGARLPSTDTGAIYTLLESGSTFFDRGRPQLQEAIIQYEAMVPVAYQYAYDLQTGETTLSNKPSQEFANHFMRMTPFTQWRLRLPRTALENQGLCFPSPTPTPADATTQVSISFHLTAIRSRVHEHTVLRML